MCATALYLLGHLPRILQYGYFFGMIFRKKQTYHHAGSLRGEAGTKAIEALPAITGKL